MTTGKIPVHALNTAGDFDGLSEYQSNEVLQVDYGLLLAKGHTIAVDAADTWGWKDVVGEITVRGSGANDPTWTNWRDGLWGYAFPGSGSSLTQCWINFHIPHEYVDGTDVYFHVHYLNATASPSTNNIVWQFEYSAAKGFNQAAFPASQTVSVTQACSGTRYQHMIAETAAVTISGLEVDSLVCVRIFRDAAHASDTNTDTVILLTSDMHIQVNKFATKNKAYPFNT